MAPALVAVLITNLYLDVARKRSAGRVKASLTLAAIVSDETCSLEINREMSMPWNGSREDTVANLRIFCNLNVDDVLREPACFNLRR